MKVGLLTTSFPRYAGDVAGDFVLGFARALHHHGHNIEVLAPEPREHFARYAEPGIAVRHIPYARPRQLQRTFYGAGVPDNLARDPLAWLGLAPFCASLVYNALARRSDWEALVSHWAVPCALAAGAVRAGRPHLAVLHSADIHVLSRLPARAQLATAIARGADALWFVSEAQRTRFCALLPRGEPLPRTLVCPMGIDAPTRDVFDADTRAEFRRRHQLHGFCVLLLGRHVAIKGYDIALRAAAMGGDITLLIAGEGPMRASWMRQAREHNVSVRWLGAVHGDEKQRWLRAADAFALPSRTLANGRSEGLPCALLEALASGLPAVASDLPGIRELQTIAPSLMLIPPDDPAALHSALLTLRETTSADDSLTARAICEQFGWQNVGARLNALLSPA
ncbi:MAG TPA: glycosyltransferase family 4 protein [Polyangiales bacterium]|nr:glycosyltransferase family 4 protein [Polyangiales bacterium]